MRRGPLRGLDLLAAAEDGDHATEIATERAADRRLIDTRPASEDRRMQILVNGNLVIRRIRKFVGSAPRTLGRNMVGAASTSKCNSRDRHRIPLASDHFQ